MGNPQSCEKGTGDVTYLDDTQMASRRSTRFDRVPPPPVFSSPRGRGQGGRRPGRKVGYHQGGLRSLGLAGAAMRIDCDYWSAREGSAREPPRGNARVMAGPPGRTRALPSRVQFV